MKKFNLFKEIIVVQKIDLLKAINTSKEFAITISGEIKHEPYASNDIFVFQGKHAPAQSGILTPKAAPSIAEILGKNYQIVEDDDRVLIKAFSNWQELIRINTPRASYDDTTGDGVSEFSDKILESIGWHATEFSINYRSLVEEIEEKCEGILLCIEQESPYQFSGLGFIKDNEQAQSVLFEYCKNKIKEMMSNDALYEEENLTDDELEAVEFFKLA
ncbi:MAG: hypothetical protein FP820_06115 [Sulfurimonas sp.]|nr:hypothetical protein [Sulfurimonas sp.]MBU3938586.1 hypothetical protein [bacterium]MBU4024653.1 hypothetical protein [bacterium]MBU4059578.1 hypothetical protein [bacterium]MBU4111025.1 hypothetical protein [bacterium]